MMHDLMAGPKIAGRNVIPLGDIPALVNAFVAQTPKPTGGEIAELIRPLPEGPRMAALRALSMRGVSRQSIGLGLAALETETSSKVISTIWGVLAMASMAASTYHGYRRNQSIGWALVWGLAGAVFPVVTPAIALAQGFGKRA